MTMVQKTSLYKILAITCFMATSAVHAESTTPKPVDENGSWQGYSFREDGKKICYMISKPEKEEGNYSKRGDIFAFITHRPSVGVFDEVSFDTGYTYKKDSSVKVDIDGSNYTLVTEGSRSWANTAAGDKALVRAMKNGRDMVVHGTSSRGTKTKDTYSLIGYTATYNAIKKACGK